MIVVISGGNFRFLLIYVLDIKWGILNSWNDLIRFLG